jgi:hypothetical protein
LGLITAARAQAGSRYAWDTREEELGYGKWRRDTTRIKMGLKQDGDYGDRRLGALNADRRAGLRHLAWAMDGVSLHLPQRTLRRQGPYTSGRSPVLTAVSASCLPESFADEVAESCASSLNFLAPLRPS